ncbi:MAG: putative CAMK protein kinase [Streblomastix strix]|uniref:Putative CAMK protein kinase n=1 Tax=Streblomastix strix TaxID=222440 RepID=A0A5J4WHR6_9EUKA|nr:MAG: putative CAMK protein kinase [Streblomastix strix]
MKQNIRIYELKEDKITELEQYVEDEANDEIIIKINDEEYKKGGMVGFMKQDIFLEVASHFSRLCYGIRTAIAAKARSLSHGGFGNQQLGIVAAKVMREADFNYEEWKVGLALSREGNNPYILKYFTTNSNSENTVILMEYANMGSLQDLIETNKDLSLPIIRVIMKQLLEGLRLMHEKGLIHRDLKAENIMLHSPIGSGRVQLKIMDFGLVKVQKKAQQSTHMTVAGTFPYMPPELLLGSNEIKADSKVDIWSAGILFHLLASHQFPFESLSLQSIISFMIAKKLNRPTNILDEVLWNLITKMLSFDGKDRISATEALNHEFFTGEKADEEIPVNAFRLAQTAQKALQKGDKNINQYDLDASFTFPYSDAKEIVNKDPESEMKTIQNKFNLPSIQRTANYKTSHVVDTLIEHVDESGELNSEYFAPVLTIPNIEFFTSLNIASIFPDVRFYVVIAHLDETSNIILEQTTSQHSLDNFALIIRHNPQNINIIRSYFEEELKRYQDLEIQNAHDLIYIGFSPLQDGCCVVFLTSSTLTLESGIQQGLLLNNLIKLQITKSLIDSIQYAHQNNIIGFDIRPNTILITQDINKHSIALIGYVGQKDQLSKHPNNENIQWDSKQTAPELLVKKRKGSKISYPTSSSDIYSLDPIKQK